MRIKLLVIPIMLTMICGNFIVLGITDLHDQPEPSELDDVYLGNLKIREVRVAIFSQTILMVSCYKAFFEALDGYSWVVNGTQYNFVVEKIYDEDVYRGSLSVDNYDVLLMPGGGAGGGCRKTKWMVNRPSVRLWRNNMIKFIKDGGGYYQFYSIRHVKYGYEELVEKAQDGPDAVTHVDN